MIQQTNDNYLLKTESARVTSREVKPRSSGAFGIWCGWHLVRLAEWANIKDSQQLLLRTQH